MIVDWRDCPSNFEKLAGNMHDFGKQLTQVRGHESIIRRGKCFPKTMFRMNPDRQLSQPIRNSGVQQTTTTRGTTDRMRGLCLKDDFWSSRIHPRIPYRRSQPLSSYETGQDSQGCAKLTIGLGCGGQNIPLFCGSSVPDGTVEGRSLKRVSLILVMTSSGSTDSRYSF